MAFCITLAEQVIHFGFYYCGAAKDFLIFINCMMNEWASSMGWNFFCFVWYCENGNFNLINENFCTANNFNGYDKERVPLMA